MDARSLPARVGGSEGRGGAAPSALSHTCTRAAGEGAHPQLSGGARLVGARPQVTYAQSSGGDLS